MEIAVQELSKNTAKVELRGRFDMTGAVAIEVPFDEIVGAKRSVIVDLSAVTFLSSYGLRVLLVGAKIASKQGGKLALVCPENNVAKVLRMTGTDTLIPLFSDLASAQAALSAG